MSNKMPSHKELSQICDETGSNADPISDYPGLLRLRSRLNDGSCVDFGRIHPKRDCLEPYEEEADFAF